MFNIALSLFQKTFCMETEKNNSPEEQQENSEAITNQEATPAADQDAGPETTSSFDDLCSDLRPAQRIFVQEMIMHGDKVKAYQKAYPDTSGKWVGSHARNLYYKKHIRQRITEGQLRIQHEVEKRCAEEMAQSLKDDLAMLQGIRESCADIISGKMTFEKIVKMEDSIRHEQVKADSWSVLQALNLCFKMASSPAAKANIPRPKLMIGDQLFK
jgi:hypothetical protein